MYHFFIFFLARTVYQRCKTDKFSFRCSEICYENKKKRIYSLNELKLLKEI